MSEAPSKKAPSEEIPSRIDAYLVAGGRYHDANLIGCLGHYVGTFENDWLGIPATRGVVAVRGVVDELLNRIVK